MRKESHLQDEDQQGGADEQWDQAANEPAQPQDPIIQSHNPHGLLQTCLFLIHYAFNNDGHWVHPS